MASSDWVKYYRVKVPNRSGADRGFLRSFTGIVGTEYPVLCKEVIPATMVNVDVAHSVQLPPLASDTFANVDFNLEAFFVPTRILYGSYEAWQTGGKIRGSDGDLVSPTIPRLRVSWSQQTEIDLLRRGSLADFLGFRFTDSDLTYLKQSSDQTQGGLTDYFGVWKFLAYHRVINDWYLRGNVQNFIFNKNIDDPTALENFPWASFETDALVSLTTTFADGYHLGDLRQRNFGSDYFTEAFVNAQAGAAPVIDIMSSLDVDTSASDGTDLSLSVNSSGVIQVNPNRFGNITQKANGVSKLTLAVIRAANSLTQYAERNQLPSPRMQDWVHAQYGADLSDGVAQRAMLLGSASFNVYTRAVEQNSQAPAGQSEQPNNPFSSVGARYGNAYSTGDKHLVDHFTANEPGYIIVMACLTPKVRYATGIDKDNVRYNRQGSQVDMPNPILQNTGYEPIYQYELSARRILEKNVFGYTDRYADCLVSVDQINGLLRDGENLQSFALQRSFDSGVEVSHSFLQIPKNYLKNIEAVDNQASGFDYWCDMFIDFKVAHPLQQYSIPTLQDPAYEHGKSVVMRRNGSRVD